MDVRIEKLKCFDSVKNRCLKKRNTLLLVRGQTSRIAAGKLAVSEPGPVSVVKRLDGKAVPAADLSFFYMKYSANPMSISTFVVGGPRSECGPPVAVYMKYSVNAGSISRFVVGEPTSERGPPVAVI